MDSIEGIVGEIVSILAEKGLRPKKTSTLSFSSHCPYRDKHSAIGTKGGGNNSMHYNAEMNIYHCFSCGSKGKLHTIAGWLGLNPNDTIRLYTMAGRYSSKSVKQDNKLKDDLIIPKPPRLFLRRGFTEETLNYFSVSIRKNKNGGYDAVIPYFNSTRGVVGYKFRSISNPREFEFSAGFNKTSYLYNDYGFRECVVVESETDTWRVTQNGTRNVVSTLSSSVTEGQVAELGNKKHLILAFDNDFAGLKAALYIYHKLYSKTRISFACFNSEDAGACGEEEWQKAITSPRTYMYWEIFMRTKLGAKEFIRIREEAVSRIKKEKKNKFTRVIVSINLVLYLH
jgi:hypothetical protein